MPAVTQGCLLRVSSQELQDPDARHGPPLVQCAAAQGKQCVGARYNSVTSGALQVPCSQHSAARLFDISVHRWHKRNCKITVACYICPTTRQPLSNNATRLPAAGMMQQDPSHFLYRNRTPPTHVASCPQMPAASPLSSTPPYLVWYICVQMVHLQFHKPPFHKPPLHLPPTPFTIHRLQPH